MTEPEEQLNIPALRKVRKQIYKYGPEHFNMHSWLRQEHPINGTQELVLSDEQNLNGVSFFKDCGTAGCFAGHAAICEINQRLKKSKDNPMEVSDFASRYDEEQARIFLGLPYGNLFHVDHWPFWTQLESDKLRHKLDEANIGYSEYQEAINKLEWRQLLTMLDLLIETKDYDSIWEDDLSSTKYSVPSKSKAKNKSTNRK